MKARIIGAALVVGVGIAAFALTRGDESTAAAPVAGASSPALVWNITPARELEPGIERRYEVELAHATHQPGREPFALGIGGEWRVNVLSTDESGVTAIRAELHDARVRLGASWSPAPLFAVPYTFTLTREGTLLALQLPRALPSEIRAALTAITASAQITTRQGASWTAIESDSLGAFEAQYSRDKVKIYKTKRGYRSRTGGESVAIDVLRSGTVIELREDGWPMQLDHEELIRVGFDKASVTVDGRVTMRWAGSKTGVVAMLPANLEAVAIDGVSSQVDRDAADRELLDGATLQDLLATLGATRDDGNSSAHTYLRLVALFRLDAEAAKQAASKVLAGTLDKRDNAAVIGALGEAGTPETQHLLAGIVEAPTLAQEHRVHGTLSLGLTEDPTRETLATLATTSRLSDPELADTATLALGNAALRLRDRDAAEAAAQVDELLARLRVSPLEVRVTLIRALGNTGDPRALPAIAEALRSRSELERAAATEALRMLPGPEVDKLIELALLDGAPMVREAAVFAASDRPLASLLVRLTAIGVGDEVVTVRRAVVELAASRLAEHDELRRLLSRVGKSDPDPELRATALRFLKQT